MYSHWSFTCFLVIEKFWTEVGKIVARNDQMKINIGLEKMKVTPLSMEYDKHQDWRVLRGRYNFVVKIVPLNNFCRNNYCEKEKQTKYFIWNKGKLKEADLWFLKENWKSNSKLKGRAWLESVASWYIAIIYQELICLICYGTFVTLNEGTANSELFRSSWLVYPEQPCIPRPTNDYINIYPVSIGFYSDQK